CDSDSTSSMAARSGAIVFWRRYYNRHEGMGQPSHQPVVTQCARGITVHDDAAHDVDRLAGGHPGHMRPSQRRSVGTIWSRRHVVSSCSKAAMAFACSASRRAIFSSSDLTVWESAARPDLSFSSSAFTAWESA